MPKKHLVYAEDVIYEIMQYPSSTISKGIVKQLIDKVTEEKEIQPSAVGELENETTESET